MWFYLLCLMVYSCVYSVVLILCYGPLAIFSICGLTGLAMSGQLFYCATRLERHVGTTFKFGGFHTQKNLCSISFSQLDRGKN